MDYVKNGKKVLGIMLLGILFLYDSVIKLFDILVSFDGYVLLSFINIVMNKIVIKVVIIVYFNDNGIM